MTFREEKGAMRRGMTQGAALRPEPLGVGTLLVGANGPGEKPRFVAFSAADDLTGAEGQVSAAADHGTGAGAGRRHVVQLS